DIENKLIDYLDDALTTEQRKEVEQAIANSAEVRQMYEELQLVMTSMEEAKSFQPSKNLKRNFDQFLQKEKDKLQGKEVKVVYQPEPSSVRHRIFMQVAAVAAILLLGILIGQNISEKDNQANAQEIAMLRDTMFQLLDENSTSGRIRAVNISYELSEKQAADDEIITTLIQTMNIDKSTNVRLAAMEALFQFADEPQVRTALCETLKHQTNPNIQLTLIKMLVKMKEKQAVKYFEGLIEKDEIIQEVKDQAQMGIFKMM
ncbi:MAG: HEAT repeat domain-containing protein, partial [Bacteroidota bacterium]